jgi:hypothetical protein
MFHAPKLYFPFDISTSQSLSLTGTQKAKILCSSNPPPIYKKYRLVMLILISKWDRVEHMKKLLASTVYAYDANHMKEQPIVSWKLSAKSVATSGSVHEIIVSGNIIASFRESN